MKKIYLILGIFCMSLSSCSDSLLDTKPLDKFSEETVWSNASTAQAFTYNTYKLVLDKYLVELTDLTGLGAGFDEVSDNFVIQDANKITQDQIDKYYDAGWNVFTEIRACNKIIEKVTASNFTEADKKNLIGQGKFLRALIYFRQARLFGKYVKIDKVLTPQDDLVLPRTNTIKETYDFILKDLKDAAELLPVDTKSGVISKGVALALEAEVALHGASYIESGADDYYKITVSASEELFALNKYSLDSDYEGLFNDHDKGLHSTENIFVLDQNADVTKGSNTRQIWLLPSASDPVQEAWIKPSIKNPLIGWSSRWPSSELVADYLVKDEDGVAKRWNETSYYKNWEAKGGDISDVIYKNRDARFYASIIYDKSNWFGNTVTTREKGNMTWGSSLINDVWMTKTGYYCKKGVYEDKTFVIEVNMSYHIPILRLGRSYLNYAEAKLRLGGADNIKTAIEYINKTRTVHGNMPALSTSLSLEDAWKSYKMERRVELFYEDDRYWSLLRWGKADGQEEIPELNEGSKAIDIAEDGSSYKFINIPDVNDINIKSFSSRRYLFPVPESQRVANEKLDQNPEWN